MKSSASSPADDPAGSVTRFAPSPTGELHLGNARTALFNLLLARRAGGRFVLRIEDTDTARSRDSHTTALMDDLRWLGIDWDAGPDREDARGPYRQSQRGGLYERYFAGARGAAARVLLLLHAPGTGALAPRPAGLRTAAALRGHLPRAVGRAAREPQRRRAYRDAALPGAARVSASCSSTSCTGRRASER